MIYFIQAKDDPSSPIKIGITRSLAARFEAIQRGNSAALHVLGTTSGDYKDEALIHRAFCRQHIRCEWFHYSSFLRHVVQGLIEDGIEHMRPVLNELAEDGYGIRIKSEAGLKAIREGVMGSRNERRASTPSIHGELQ